MISAFCNSLVLFVQDSTLVAVIGNNSLWTEGAADIAILENWHDQGVKTPPCHLALIPQLVLSVLMKNSLIGAREAELPTVPPDLSHGQYGVLHCR